jgi:tetratricopeptide (TPR) repeat protein
MHPASPARCLPDHALATPGLLPLAAALLTAFFLVGCGGDQADRVPLGGPGSVEPMQVEDLPPHIQAQLDSANAAFRARDHESALAHFTRVSELAPGLAAGWYGIGMTHSALGNQEEANAAMMQAHRLAPEIPLEHPTGQAPPNPHPSRPPTSDEDEGGY